MATKHVRQAPGAPQHRGITLLEVCVVAVAATALPSFSALIDSHRLEAAATRLAAAVQFEAKKTLRYVANASLRLDAVAVDATAAAAGVSSPWDDTGEAAGPGARTSSRTAGPSVSVAIAASVATPARWARSMRTSRIRRGRGCRPRFVAENFMVVPGGESCPRDPPTAAPALKSIRSLAVSSSPHAEATTTTSPASARMAEALALAREAIGVSDPNPRVGCVIVAGDGTVLGRGHTQQAGAAHAEVMALRDAAGSGHNVRGATVHVTLEPCSHHGRTPPCADALIAAGVGRVVIAMADPNPLVAGHGAARLAAAGIPVVEGAGGDEARELNIGFVSRMERGRPWLRLKVAVSLDGRSALADGASQWITGEAARRDGHAWRKRASALLTGVGTVRDDDPRLDVRLVETARQPLRVIVDSRLETPPEARIVAPPGSVLLYAAVDDPMRRQALETRGVEVAFLPSPAGKVDLAAMLADLARRGVNELHVEAGEKLNASLLAAGLVDELLVYVAPRLIGSGRGLAALAPIARLDDALRFAYTAVDRVGDDLRLRLRPAPTSRPT